MKLNSNIDALETLYIEKENGCDVFNTVLSVMHKCIDSYFKTFINMVLLK